MHARADGHQNAIFDRLVLYLLRFFLFVYRRRGKHRPEGDGRARGQNGPFCTYSCFFYECIVFYILLHLLEPKKKWFPQKLNCFIID